MEANKYFPNLPGPAVLPVKGSKQIMRRVLTVQGPLEAARPTGPSLAVYVKRAIFYKALFTYIFLFTASISQSQDLTGIWQGHFLSNGQPSRSSFFDGRYKFEVQIAQKGKTFEGVTYSYLSTLFYGKAEANGTVNLKNGKVILQEGKLLEFHNPVGDAVCIMTCFMQYSRINNEEFLEGTYTSMSLKDSSYCGKGNVLLRRVVSSDFYEEPIVTLRKKELEEIAKTKEVPKNTQPLASTGTPQPAARNSGTSRTTNPGNAPLAAAGSKPKGKTPPPAAFPLTPSIAKVNPEKAPLHPIDTAKDGGMEKKFPLITPRVLLSRSNQLVKAITVNTNEVILNIYDDGIIDHDTISVYLDKKLVISHAMLTDQPIVLKLHLDDTINFHELVMVAENEGDIPPNTSLMIVKAGDQRYEVRITSTEQKNAVVTFRYSPEPFK